MLCVTIALVVMLKLVHTFKYPYCRPSLVRSFSGKVHDVQTKAGKEHCGPVVVLEEGKGRLFKGGNPIIYGGAVSKVLGSPKEGEFVAVTDHRGNLVGKGFFNSISQYRVRLVSHGVKHETDLTVADLIRSRIQQAVALRKALVLPSISTNTYRLVNGEGDQLSGLIIDVFDNIVSIQSSATWVEIHAEAIVEAVQSALSVSPSQIIWKRADSRLKKDGFRLESAKSMGSTEVLENITVRENDIIFTLDPEGDQKTGFYCDQRLNRLLIRGLSQGKHVLDTYCYTGGFTLNALVGGAASVTAVDSSTKAIETLACNLQCNPILDASRVTTIEADCDSAMKNMIKNNQSFDVVICDPPKLAPTRSHLSKAKSKYTKINSMAMQLISPTGGLLLTCSCSGAMTQSGDFIKMLKEAAEDAGRRITVLSESGASPDHTVAVGYPEGKYLTAVLLHVH